MRGFLCRVGSILVFCSFLSDTPVYAEKQNNPHIGIAGSDFVVIQKGEWHALLEQAVIMVRTTNDQMWLVNFGSSGREGKRFQSLRVERSCVANQGDFVSLDYQCVLERQAWTWDEIKKFFGGKMLKEEYESLITAVAKYLGEQKLI